jgi:hypothetical protein
MALRSFVLVIHAVYGEVKVVPSDSDFQLLVNGDGVTESKTINTAVLLGLSIRSQHIAVGAHQFY